MREILFRGRRINNGEWVEGDLLNLPVGIAILANGYAYVDPATIGQFTGLCDKNGKKIFEGDIVKAYMDFGPGGTAERKVSIYWDEDVGGWKFNYFDMRTIEVIGNVHDNPDLLNE